MLSENKNMIKFHNIAFIFKIHIILFIVIWGALNRVQSQTITYEITAGNLSKEAVDSYPQKLLNYQICEDSTYKIVVSTFPAYNDSIKREIVNKDRYSKSKVYPPEINKYLDSTPLVNYNLPEIEKTADSILNIGEPLTKDIILLCLKYSSKRIAYDNELAMELDKGKSTTLSVETILNRGKGTCSEYTNLFLALTRRLGIPSRMAVGYIYIPDKNFEGSHAWAECYINNYGWLAVDPQNGFMWFPPVAVKLFHGKDFIDCNIKTLPDMYPVKMKIKK